MGQKAKWEYFRAIYQRYRQAGRKQKQAILNEFCVNTGYHRKYAIRRLNGPRPGKGPEKGVRRRGYSYGPQALSILAEVCEAAAYPWSVRLKALSDERGNRESIAADQCAADGSPSAGKEEGEEEAHLRADQAGAVAEASDCGEDGELGRDHAGVH